MTSASVSYIVPVYDGEAYLAEALDSIFAQTLPALEVLVVDDGSSDATPAVARRYGRRITYLRQSHAGQSVARNHGIRVARGDLLAFLDADDLVHPNRLVRQVARFEARPELDVSQAFTRNFWSPEIPEAERTRTPLERFTHSDVPFAESVGGWLVRRALFERIGGFEEGRMFGEDVAWLDRARASGAVIETMPVVLARRRLHHGNLTRRDAQGHLDGLALLYRYRVEQQRSRREPW
ncbi:MAG TPA: glycosyltransferase family A protein [Candidatus Methylomirabilis sp.]|nr:glycosyltransferase family A protein [Candidatus Methylomirabilis sp.]